MSAYPRRRLSSRMRPFRTPSRGCSSVTATLAKPATGTDAPARRSGSHLLASRWSGSARGLRREGSGTGTGAPVSVHMNSLLCLLSDTHRGEGLGIPSPLLGCHFWQYCSAGFFWVLMRFRLVRLLGSRADTVHVSVFGGYWLLFLILRPRHGETRSLSYTSEPQPPQPPQDVSSQVLLSCSLQVDSRGHHGMPWRSRWTRRRECPAPQGATAEASYVSSSSISAFRAAIVRAVWSSKMPLANAPAILNLLYGPVGVDPVFHVIWSRFRMMRRYLSYCPEEEPRI